MDTGGECYRRFLAGDEAGGFGNVLLRRGHAPHPVEGVRVERQVVDFTVIIRDGAVGIPVERDKSVHEVPYLLVVRVENVGPVLVHMDPFHFLAVDIAAQMGALLDHQAGLACLPRLVGEGGAEEARTDDQIVISFPCIHTWP